MFKIVQSVLVMETNAPMFNSPLQMPRSRDTTPEADAVQLAIYRRLSVAERTAIGDQLSIAARRTSLNGIKHRHPEYDERTYGSERWRRLVKLLSLAETKTH
ncbi:MAG: hypothetical protein QM831_36820 [Kofleriaceae bacterium]